jgi:hypothetical protein
MRMMTLERRLMRSVVVPRSVPPVVRMRVTSLLRCEVGTVPEGDLRSGRLSGREWRRGMVRRGVGRRLDRRWLEGTRWTVLE